MLTNTASKVAAERAFWKFFEDNKVDFDGVACNPACVSLHSARSARPTVFHAHLAPPRARG